MHAVAGPEATGNPKLMDVNNRLSRALDYAANGWSVFPLCSPLGEHRCLEHPSGCESPGKTPLIKWSIAQQSIATQAQIRHWWTYWTKANIGLATGAISGVCVIDLDGTEAFNQAKNLGLPNGPYVTTGRIGGRHVYCKWRNDAPTIFARRTGIDFRGAGGYVVLPPSRHKTGVVYTWSVDPHQAELPELPAWVDELATTDSTGEKRKYVDIGRLFSEGIPEGERDITLFRVAAKLRAVDVPEDVALGVLLELAARCRPPFDQAETRRKIESAYKRYKPSLNWDWPMTAGMDLPV